MNTRNFLVAVSVLSLSCLIAKAQSHPINGIGTGASTAGEHTFIRPVIKEKPEPNWPSSLQKKSEIVIVLRAVFRSDGKVTNISFVGTSPKQQKDYSKDEVKDLTRKAKEAAREIKFIPATRDGHPVSMLMQLEYDFSLDNETKPKSPSPN